MSDIAGNDLPAAKITADGAGCGFGTIRRPEEVSDALHGAGWPLEDKEEHRRREEELLHVWIERLIHDVCIMRAQQLSTEHAKLDPRKPHAGQLLQAIDALPHHTLRDRIRLEENEAAFHAFSVRISAMWESGESAEWLMNDGLLTPL